MLECSQCGELAYRPTPWPIEFYPLEMPNEGAICSNCGWREKTPEQERGERIEQAQRLPYKEQVNAFLNELTRELVAAFAKREDME